MELFRGCVRRQRRFIADSKGSVTQAKQRQRYHDKKTQRGDG